MMGVRRRSQHGITWARREFRNSVALLPHLSCRATSMTIIESLHPKLEENSRRLADHGRRGDDYRLANILWYVLIIDRLSITPLLEDDIGIYGKGILENERVSSRKTGHPNLRSLCVSSP